MKRVGFLLKVKEKINFKWQEPIRKFGWHMDVGWHPSTSQ